MLGCAFLATGGLLHAQSAPTPSQLSETLESLSARVQPAVVQVLATGYAPGQGLVGSSNALLSREQGTGSGFIVDAAGYIVTNAHVIANATRVLVELPPRPEVMSERRSVIQPRGELVTAQVVGADQGTDLAVLRVQVDRPLPVLSLGDSEELNAGELVMAFGSPLGLANSVSMGVVSAVARQTRVDDEMIYIQTDASINPGNSGGPLVDMDGQVVGINTFIISQSGGHEGIGFAVPSNIVSTVYEQIRRFGRVRRGEIGVRAQTITPELAQGLGLSQDWGVVLADVHPGGPAHEAGLQVGDIVLTLDDKVIENARQLQVNLFPRRAGEQVEVAVLRGDRQATYTVFPVDRRSDPDRFERLVNPDQHLIPRLGILALNITPEVAAMLPPLRRSTGVVVAVSSPRAVPVRGEPLLPGDIIHALNEAPVGSLVGLRTAVSEVAAGAPAVLHVERGGELLFVALTLE